MNSIQDLKTLQQVKILARIGKKTANKTILLPTKQQIDDACQYIKSLSGSLYVHSNYARNVLIALAIPGLQLDELLDAITNSKKIYINSYI